MRSGTSTNTWEPRFENGRAALRLIARWLGSRSAGPIEIPVDTLARTHFDLRSLLSMLVAAEEGETAGMLARVLDEAESVVGRGRVLFRLFAGDDPTQDEVLARGSWKWFPEEEWRRYLMFAKTKVFGPRLLLERGRWLLSAPLQYGGRPFGLLAATTRKPSGFSEMQVSVLLLLSTLASTILYTRRVLDHTGESLVDEERKRIAQDIHDRLVPGLFTVKLGAEACRQHIGEDPREVGQILDRMQETISRTMTDLRDYIYGLRSDHPDRVDLAGAIERSVRDMSNGDGPRGSLSIQGSPRSLPTPIALCLFSIAQEAIANVLRHAEAGSFEVVLGYGEREIALTIRDDGKGFDVAAAQLRAANELSGLRNMRDRVGGLSGEVRIDSRQGKGSIVHVLLPLEE